MHRTMKELFNDTKWPQVKSKTTTKIPNRPYRTPVRRYIHQHVNERLSSICCFLLFILNFFMFSYDRPPTASSHDPTMIQASDFDSRDSFGQVQC